MIFLNYRKIDSTPETRILKGIFDQVFGLDATLLDYYSMEGGEEWSENTEFELCQSKIAIVIIGPNWLKASDFYGNRLLDKKNDWVRIEIEKALKNKLYIIPLLIGGAKVPPSEVLPTSIKDICNYQFYELRDLHWKTDINPLIQRIKELAISEISLPKVKIPKYRDYISNLLTPTELTNKLSELTGWRIQTVDVPNKKIEERNELVRNYEFINFLEAIKFMSEAAIYIDKVNHHPKWENVWINLVVHLSSWDIGYDISALDFDLAFYLDNLYNTSYKSDGKQNNC